jgi:periplasmic protein TonB
MNTIRLNQLARYPLALAVGVLVTMLLFKALYGLTNVSFVPSIITTPPIELVPVRESTPIVVKERPKPPEKPVIKETFGDGIGKPPIDIVIPPATKGEKFAPPGIGKVEGGGDIINLNPGSDRDIAPIVRVEPIYPTRAETRGIEGWVRVRFNISATGEVTDAMVVESDPSGVFDQSVLSAIGRWRYSPKVENGTAVERRGIETILRFELPE